MGLSDDWIVGAYFDTEKQARDELGWLVNHSPYREFLLVSRELKDLDDEIGI